MARQQFTLLTKLLVPGPMPRKPSKSKVDCHDVKLSRETSSEAQARAHLRYTEGGMYPSPIGARSPGQPAAFWQGRRLVDVTPCALPSRTSTAAKQAMLAWIRTSFGQAMARLGVHNKQLHVLAPANSCDGVRSVCNQTKYLKPRASRHGWVWRVRRK